MQLNSGFHVMMNNGMMNAYGKLIQRESCRQSCKYNLKKHYDL